MIRVGLVGHGRAGQAVAQVLSQDARFDLRWIARRNIPEDGSTLAPAPMVTLSTMAKDGWLNAHPIDGLIDFSSRESIHVYGPALRQHGAALVSAISAYEPSDIAFARELAQDIRVLCSPNITLGINFMLVAARMLRGIAPEVDVEIVEQHFRDKPEVSGTARKLAETLDIGEDRITSLRLGGIVGHHEVIFGFPYQTVRIVHDAIKREAFGTGAAFAMRELLQHGPGFYRFEDLINERVAASLLLPQNT